MDFTEKNDVVSIPRKPNGENNKKSYPSDLKKIYLTSVRWGVRHTFALMAFLGFTVLFALKSNLSVATVAMVSTSE